MEIKILEERTNPLLHRHELRFEVAHAASATPTRDSVRDELAKAVRAPKDRVVIERMLPRFGTAVTRGEANVYDTADAAKSITREHILVRNRLKEKEAKGQAAPATPTAPAPAGAAPATTPPPVAAPSPPAPAKGPETKAAAPEPTAAPKATSGEAPAPPEPAKRTKAHAKKE